LGIFVSRIRFGCWLFISLQLGTMAPSKIMTQPIVSIIFYGFIKVSTNVSRQNLIFRFLQNRTKVIIWLYEETSCRIEGKISGFDEYMNLVLDEAVEWNIKKNTRTNLGRILLKGDTITLIQPA